MKSDRGNVVVEFVGVAIGMLIPVVFVANGCWAVAQAHLALRDAAVSSARGFVLAENSNEGAHRLNAIIADVVNSAGISPGSVTHDVSCSTSNCLAGGTYVTVRVKHQVRFEVPIFGAFTIPISDSHTEQVDEIK